MGNKIGIFQRTEKKYGLTAEQYKDFLNKAKDKIKADRFGMHTISNIYYDTADYELIRHSIEKPKFKEKLRVRGYGDITEKTPVYLELKKKVRGVVYKRRTSMPHSQAKRYMINRVLPKQHDQVMREIDYFLSFYNPMAKLYLAYDRMAYAGTQDPDLRITVDQNIRSRDYDLDLTKGDYGTIQEKPEYLMEIKVLGAYPVWLAKVLSELEIYPISFSKYGMIYKQNIFGQISDRQLEESEEQGVCLQAHLAV